MDFNTFERLFVPFCESPNVNSRKARSYYLAIRHLAEYLNLPDFGHGNARRILEKEDKVKDRDSNFYQQLLRCWEAQSRSSYLEKGFIQAAMPYFARFAADNNLL